MDSSLIQTFAVYALPVLFAITLHEAAHGYVAKHFGDNTTYLLGRVSAGTSREAPAEPVVILDDAAFAYTSSPVLTGVTGTVLPGEALALIGPNGSGKTTLLRGLLGMVRIIAGSLRVNGAAPGRAPRGSIGYVPQVADLDPSFPVTVLDVVLMGTYSRLVLDEPTSGIDPVARAELWEFLRRRRHEGVAVLASTHDLSEAEAYADRLLVLNRGRLVLQGPVEDVLGLAGGRWRLRLIGVAPDVDAWARRHDVELIGTGDTRLLVGSRDEVVRVGERVEAARERGGLGCQDVLRGPIRLEDVFTYAVTVGAASAVGTAGAAATSAEGRAAR